MAKYQPQRSDLTDEQWEFVKNVTLPTIKRMSEKINAAQKAKK